MNIRPHLSATQLALIMPIFITLLVLVDYSCVGLSSKLNQLLADHWLQAAARERQPDKRILIINIDSYSRSRILTDVPSDLPVDLPLSIHAEMLNALTALAPKAIIFDLGFFSIDPSNDEDAQAFNQSLAKSSNVFIPWIHFQETLESSVTLPLAKPAEAWGLDSFSYADIIGISKTAGADSQARIGGLLPFAIDPHHWLTGDVSLNRDSDGVVRQYRLQTDYDGWKIPSLAARLMLVLDKKLPSRNNITLNGFSDSHRTVSYARMLDSLYNQQPLVPLADHIIIIGSSQPVLHDTQQTPVHPQTPGISIIATAIDNLLNKDYLYAVPQWLNLLLSVFIIILLAYFYRRATDLRRLVFGLLAGSLLLLLAGANSIAFGWSGAFLSPLLFAWLYILLLYAVKRFATA